MAVAMLDPWYTHVEYLNVIENITWMIEFDHMDQTIIFGQVGQIQFGQIWPIKLVTHVMYVTRSKFWLVFNENSKHRGQRTFWQLDRLLLVKLDEKGGKVQRHVVTIRSKGHHSSSFFLFYLAQNFPKKQH